MDARTSIGEVSPSRGAEDHRADVGDDIGSSRDSSRGGAEEKNSADRGAGEVLWKSDSSSDGFRQLSVTTSGVPPSVEMLAAFEAKLWWRLSISVAGEHAQASGVASVGGPEPSEVAVRAPITEAVPTVSALEDPVTATPVVGVLPTSEAQSEGLDDRIPRMEEGNRPTREDTEVAGNVPLFGSAPAVALSSQPGFGAPDEPQGALVSISGSGAFRRRLQVVAPR